MQKIQIHFCALIFFTLTCILKSQTVYVPLNNNVYDFLERLKIRQIIYTDDEVLPFSRKYISNLLKEIELKYNLLNEIEKAELQWYKKEFAYELGLPDDQKRWHLYSYSDSLFTTAFSPIISYGISANGDKSGHTRWWGASLYASYSNWFGMHVSARDKGEYGSNVDRDKSFSPVTGASIKGAPNGIEFTDVTGSINFNWSWGSISLIKDYFQWGHGNFGQLIFSQKAPSFPRIQLLLKPTEDIRFSYIHGFLNSLVPDSSEFYYSYPDALSPRLREGYINKYIAANLFTFNLFDLADLSLGNSIVYTGDIRPEFFIPFMFFKFLDHNTGRLDIEDGNGQLFVDAALNYPAGYRFYTTFFLDVTEIRNILEGDYKNTWYGITAGIKKTDLLISNLDFTTEYTRISPWVYEHKDEAATYKHINYYLGHWIGQNADQFRVQFDYRFIRPIHLSVYFEIVRKGGLLDTYYAYEAMTALPFLYPPLRRDYRTGLFASYEALHDLFIRAEYNYSDIEDEKSDRTLSFLTGAKHNFSLNFFYGL